ncbi:hypothetical protein LTR99_007037 [Exophiala xenobiotica]|uniref:Uncharacterized protein n=1 Tax=Vermiconidia calcicola TaxID=1690605 RepID=A0AAV9PVP6_9PEZI|nr:hypothetical protein LTR92_006855 [Exophiala xenobiotica]KAK5528831.1 hypothetical protein LTR25_010014 [Vermiconidia calcicola]KAK5539439.1 hypothetical protein LTR23_006459 [Chaetothyriales sp. CCFEE 6169]KAK5221139.1 hypothetical protein LTR72_006699 [Exophiala xenobiotica]KAK5269603.1 hypothetical protein LTR96_005299 [Exophiala xenobiotica]
MAPQFLFVNKDADSASLTRSNSSEQSSINSHVQRGRRHKRSGGSKGRSGIQGRRTAKSSKTADTSDELQPGSGSAKYTSSPSPSKPKDEAPESGVTAPKPLPARPSPKSKTPRLTASSKARPRVKFNRRSRSLSPGSVKASKIREKAILLLNPNSPLNSPRDISQMTSDSIDPFGLSVVKMDPHIAELCRYFCDKFHPSVWHAESWTLGGRYTYQSSSTAIIRRAMQNEVEMNAILACMAARIENVDMIPGQGTDKFMGNALMAVRRRFSSLSSASKHQLLLIIFHLYAGEAYRQNWQAARIHMRAAKTLFDSWGGLSHVPDQSIRESFIIGDGNVSACVMEPCELPCEYDPGGYFTVTPPEMLLVAPRDLSTIAPALQDILTDGYLPDALAESILETVECAWVLRHARTGSSPEATKYAARWLLWRNSAVRYRLLATRYSDAVHEAIRTALFVWILTAMVVPLGVMRIAGLNAPRLLRTLKAADWPTHQWRGLLEVNMWILALGAMSAVIDSEEERWYLDQLFEVGMPENIRRYREFNPDVETVDVLKRFHERFFYYEPIQRLRLQRLAQLIGGAIDFSSNTVSLGTPSDRTSKSRSPP